VQNYDYYCDGTTRLIKSPQSLQSLHINNNSYYYYYFTFLSFYSYTIIVQQIEKEHKIKKAESEAEAETCLCGIAGTVMSADRISGFLLNVAFRIAI
jgi:hypothetical protein